MHHSANVTLSSRTGPNRVAPHITAPNKAAMLLTSTDACLNNTLGRQLGEEYSHKWEPRQGRPGGPRESVLGSATVRTLCLQPCHAIIAIYYHFTPDYTSRMTTNLDTNSTAFFQADYEEEERVMLKSITFVGIKLKCCFFKLFLFMWLWYTLISDMETYTSNSMKNN